MRPRQSWVGVAVLVLVCLVSGSGVVGALLGSAPSSAPTGGSSGASADLAYGPDVIPGEYSVTFSESGLPSGSSWSVTFDGTTHTVTTTSTEFETTKGTYAFSVGSPSGYSASPSSGSVTVTDASIDKPIAFSADPPTYYDVSFVESGLASPFEWWVNLSGQNASLATSNLTFLKVNGGYTYTIGVLKPSYAHCAPTHGSVTVDGSSVKVSVTCYALTAKFTETGLLAGTSWWVNLTDSGGSYNASSSTSTVALDDLLNGDYTFTVEKLANYTLTPRTGTLEVSNDNRTEDVTYVLETYPVEFGEQGLPTGHGWDVQLGTVGIGTDSPTWNFTESNGSYPFWASASGYVASPANGTLEVQGPTVQNIAFRLVGTYSVCFKANGVPSGKNWSLTVNDSTGMVWAVSSQNLTVCRDLSNGTYSYAVGPIAGYNITNSSGAFMVDGTGLQKHVAFTGARYSVTYTESGLPIDTNWTVTFNETPRASANTSHVFWAANNASYPYSIPDVGVYNSTPSSGSILVDNANTTVPVVFEPARYPVTFTENGSLRGQAWGITFNGEERSSTNATITFAAAGPDDSYNYTVSEIPRNLASDPTRGEVTLTDGPESVPVTLGWSFAVTFSGAGANDNWSVTVGGQAESSSGGGVLLFAQPNGTFSYSASAETYNDSGQTCYVEPTNGAGTFTVNGSNITVPIDYSGNSGCTCQGLHAMCIEDPVWSRPAVAAPLMAAGRLDS